MKSNRKHYHVFLGLYFTLNIMNNFFLTIPLFNKYAISFDLTFLGTATMIIGNLAVLGLIYFLVIVFFKKSRGQVVTLIAITFILNFFIFLIGILYKYYNSALSIQSLIATLKNPSDGMGADTVVDVLKDLIIYYRIIFFIPVIVVLTYYLVFRKKIINSNYRPTFWYQKISVFFASLFFLFTSFISINHQLKSWPWTAGRGAFAVQNLGAYSYYLGEMMRWNFSPTEQDYLKKQSKEEVFDYIDANFNKNKNDYTNFFGQTINKKISLSDANNLILAGDYAGINELNGIFKDKNLVVVHLESLFGLMFSPNLSSEFKDFMPNIFELKENSYFFENYNTMVGTGNSSDAELAVMTGLYSNSQISLFWDEDYQIKALPQYFNEIDYYTESINGDTPLFYNHGVAFTEHLGFQNFYSMDNFLEDGFKNEDYNHINNWISDRALTDLFDQRARSQNGNYFYYPLMMMPHTPFVDDPLHDKNFKGNFPKWDESLSTKTRRYFNFLKYVDEIVGNFIHGYNNQGALKDTVYVFYGDHGVIIDQNDLSVMYDKKITKKEMRALNQKVPAFIYAPDENGVGQFTGVQDLLRSHVDLYRTVLDLFDLDTGSDIVFGVNGVSKEHTFAIDGKAHDIYFQGFETFDYRGNYLSMNLMSEKEKSIVDKIIDFKKYSDYLIDFNLYVELNDYLKKSKAN